MMLFWKIRYLHRADQQFKDRNLYLQTKTLDPVTQAAVELVALNQSSKTERDIMKYRHLFREDKSTAGPGDPNNWDSFRTVGPSEYFEDETGKEITDQDMGPILTDSPTARLRWPSPPFPGNERVLGAVLYRTGRPAEAVQQFREAEQHRPLRAWDHLFLAMANDQLGQHELAQTGWQRQWHGLTKPTRRKRTKPEAKARSGTRGKNA